MNCIENESQHTPSSLLTRGKRGSSWYITSFSQLRVKTVKLTPPRGLKDQQHINSFNTDIIRAVPEHFPKYPLEQSLISLFSTRPTSEPELPVSTFVHLGWQLGAYNCYLSRLIKTKFTVGVLSFWRLLLDDKYLHLTKKNSVWPANSDPDLS